MSKKRKKTIRKPDIPKRPVIPPILKTNIPSDKWTFSFSYFKQIQYFGLDKSPSKWFVSLLNRLSDLSKMTRNEIASNPTLSKDFRYHKIDWNAKNIPIKRTDLNWIPKHYLENEDEFPLLQFQVSKALGRIVGFWDENRVFSIVLLDPLHNIQPAKTYNYKVDDNAPLSCEYSSLLKDIDDLKSKYQPCEKCQLYIELSQLPKKNNSFNFVLCYLNDESRDVLLKKLEEKNVSDIIELGLLSDMT